MVRLLSWRAARSFQPFRQKSDHTLTMQNNYELDRHELLSISTDSPDPPSIYNGFFRTPMSRHTFPQVFARIPMSTHTFLQVFIRVLWMHIDLHGFLRYATLFPRLAAKSHGMLWGPMDSPGSVESTGSPWSPSDSHALGF